LSKGINHITLVVSDMERTSEFLTKIFDAREVYTSSSAKYFMVYDIWIALNQGDSLSERTYNHIAFSIDDKSYDDYYKRIVDAGLDILSGRTRNSNEGRSIYFYDYDNHLFELHTGTLCQRIIL